MKKILVLGLGLALLSGCTGFNPGGSYSDLEGKVYSLKYRTSVKDAKITVSSLSSQSISKEDGSFIIKGLPTKWLTVEISAPGHATIKRDVHIESYGNKYIEFWLPNEGYTPYKPSIFFERNDNIWCTDEYGLNQKNLTDNTKEDLYYGSPSLSADGTQLAYLASNANRRPNVNDGIYMMSTDGSQRQRITDLKNRAFWLKWAPVKDLFAFSMNDIAAPDAKHIFVYDKLKSIIDDISGKTITREDYPDWAPNGERLIYTSYYSNSPIFYYEDNPNAWAKERPQIFIMERKGGKRKQLTIVGENYESSFSPDGKKIAFVSNRTDHPEVWLMNTDGTDQKQLTFTYATRCNRPIWSKDGERIIFNSNYMQKYPSLTASELWMINTDGSDLKMISNDAYNSDW